MPFILYFLIFISFIDLFAQFPITSTYAQSLGASTGLIGFIVGAYSLSNLFSNFFSGYFVDHKGPKQVMLYGFLVNGVILLLYAIATSPMQLLAIRFMNGLSAGIITPAAFTYLSLSNKNKKSGKTMAFSGAAVGLSAIGGPAFAGIVSAKSGSETVYFIIGCLMIFACVLTALLNSIEKQKDVVRGNNKGKIQELFKNKGLLFAFLGALSLSASQGILAYMLPLKVDGLELANHISGMLMSIFGIVAILFFMLPTNRVFDRFHYEWLLPIGLVIIAVAQAVAGFAFNFTFLLMSMLIYGIGFALIFPSMSSLVAKYSSQHIRGKAYGIFYAFYSLGSFLGTSITGAFSLTPTGAFFSAAVFLLVMSIGSFAILKRNSHFLANKEVSGY
ncbi:Multidrug efflux transporter [Caldibacillus thermoamylovorans]|uniref:Multidrug efflux transporter n=1 Tax=Caldibacillus thermoamylovorans TaxID=35841 RepID=A0A090IZ91_9BACI|nr:MFS transporter [Caldifermentibacillus hisashii]KIO63255.1 hypothetical protein B4065_3039 [Caldibacillus thermoamylovorans]CEE01758.1 Multidrug efflux transporter [Caldibacillus thermoamylovorans]